MSYLERLHALVIQQQAALYAGDLDWFQELASARLDLQRDMSGVVAQEALQFDGLVSDIVRMDRAMEETLRDMARRTMDQLKELALGQRRIGRYRSGLDAAGQMLDSRG